MSRIDMSEATRVANEIAAEFRNVGLGTTALSRFETKASAGGLKRVIVGRTIEIHLDDLPVVMLRQRQGWDGWSDGLYLAKSPGINGNFRKGWSIAVRIALSRGAAIEKPR